MCYDIGCTDCVCGFEGISGILSKAKYSSIAQWQSIRLLTEGLLVRAQLGEVEEEGCAFCIALFKNKQGSVVKRLRHRPFTAVTRVRFPSESFRCADVAQLAEQLICNQQVIGSSPIIGSLDL